MSKRAQQKAHEILNRTERQFPVDVNAIAATYNIEVRMQPLEDSVSGVLVIKERHAIIGVNENHHPHRQRFTIAHELGHFFLHPTTSKIFVDAAPIFFRDETSSEGSQRQEIEANAFAAELLMPEDAMRQCLEQQPVDAFDENTIHKLASEFGVSKQAVIIRLTRLGLITAYSAPL